MIDHVSLYVNDYEKSKIFYLTALKPLGYEMVMEMEYEEKKFCGLGIEGKGEIWIMQREAQKAHIGFSAVNREMVDEFHKAAMTAGAKDNGAPGPRPHYHRDYYGAFVLDPDGNNIEAVCHKAQN